MSDAPLHRNLRSIEEEVLRCDGKHRARFKMLFSADRTATDSVTCGVASVGPGEPLPLHRHAHPEVYFGLAGTARVTVGAEEFMLSEGAALFIPRNLEHAVHSDEPAQFFFVFAADSYSDVRYVYLDVD